MRRPRLVPVLLAAALAGALPACDLVLGIEPWSVDPGEAGGGGAAASSASQGGAGATSPASTAAEGGSACAGTLCGEAAECVDLASDARHCGACGHSCFAEGGCVDGVCQVVTLAGETASRYVAATGDHVVWTAGPTSLHSLEKATLAPGPALDGVLVSELAGSQTLLYFSTPTDGAGNGQVQVVDLSESAVPRVICDGPRANASVLLAEGNSVYLAPGGSSAEHGVYRCAAGGNGGDPSPLCTTGTNTNPNQLTLVGLYALARTATGNLALCSKAGTGGSATPLSGLFATAVGGIAPSLYFSDNASSPPPIMRRSADQIVTFGSEELVFQTSIGVTELHATSTHLAWRGGGRVQAALIGTPTTLLLDEAATGVVDVALDADGVYWALVDGTVRAFAFPLP